MNLSGYSRMQKDEAPNDPNLFPSAPDPIKSHPLFSGTMPVAFMTGSDPKYPTKISGQSDSMAHILDKMGLKYERTDGRYGGPTEDSFIVHNPSREQAFDLGHQFGQESVMYSQNGNHQILFTNGENAGRYHPSLPQVWYHPTEAPEDYFTRVPNQGYLRLHFDWDTLRDAPDKDRLVSRMQQPSPVQQVAKSISGLLQASLKKNEGVLPHPHLYPWHEGHTSHHFVTTGHGVLVHRNHFEGPMAKSERMLQYARAELAKSWTPSPDGALPQYGTSGTAGSPQYLGLHGKDKEIDDLLKSHGHSVYYWGGRHGRPDLARRNYDTKHLPVFDPSVGAEGAFEHQAYTNSWRKLHELAHSLTHDEVNKLYGNGRRRGDLGGRRTTREAMRSVHWEYLAMHKQRDLMRQAGIEMTDQDFHRELNTVMQDAVHRVTTGAEQHPSLHTFTANEHPVPVTASLNLIRQAAHNLGLRGPHDLAIKKSEKGKTPMADNTMTVQEMRKSLADGLRAVLAKHEEGMSHLRSRELKKSGAMCAVCGNLDKPGSCTCVLRKDEHAFVAGKGNEKKVKTCTRCGKGVDDNGEHWETVNGVKKVRKSELCSKCSNEMNKEEHTFVAGKGNEKQVKTCTRCGKGVDDNGEHWETVNGVKKVRKSELCSKCSKLGKGESCPVCKCEDNLGKCECIKKAEVATKPKKVKGDEGSGGKISGLKKGAMPAPKQPVPSSVGQVNSEMGKFQSLAGGNPAPTMNAKLTGAVPPPPTMVSAGTKPMAAGGPPPVPAAAKLPGVLGSLNNRGMKSLLAVPTRKGEKVWGKKAK